MADTKAREATTSGQTLDFPLFGNISKVKRTILKDRTTPARILNRRTPQMAIGDSALLSQLASGSSPLNGYLYQLRKVLIPSCPRCGYRKETVTHLFQFCPAYRIARRELRRDLWKNKVAHNPDNLSSSLTNLKAWPALAKFTRTTRRFEAGLPNSDIPIPERPEAHPPH